jgi:hypothetical protein
MPMRRLRVAILMATGRVRRLTLQAIVRQQGPVLGRELVGMAVVMYRQRHPITAVSLRHAAQGPQSILQAGAQARETLGKTKGDVLPVGMRQHEMVQQVREGLPRYCHLQVIHRREIRGRQPARCMHLAKEHFLGRPVLRLPLPHPSLQGPPRRLRTFARLRLL